MTGLVLDGVTVAYGDLVAVDDVSLTVASGETVALVGPSGSGKSTLLRAVAGLEPLVAGDVTAGGRSLVGVPIHERDLGLMFQDHALFPHLDVAANVAFGLRMQGWPAARRRQRAGELLDLVGLAGYGGRAVHELSGGEAQRVALARALAPEPALLMLDEPFGSLDRVLREELTVEVKGLLDRLGQTALHVTHDQDEAFAIADRVAVMGDGRLQQIGTPAELWAAPASAFVARFVGHPNVVEAEITGDGRLILVGMDAGPATALPGPALDAGRHRIVVPTAALSVVGSRDGNGNGTPLDVGRRRGGTVPAVPAVLAMRVVGVEFRDGRHRLHTEPVGGGADGGVGEGDRGRGLVVETDRSHDVGEAVTLALDPASVHPIDNHHVSGVRQRDHLG